MATWEERARLVQKAAVDIVLQQALMAECKQDPIFFFNHFLYTFDPRDGKGDLPFNLYPFQVWFVLTLVAKIIAQADIDIEKSRTMGVSWMICAVFLWFWLFVPGSSFLLGSITQEDVDRNLIDPEDTLFGKLRYMLDWLPSWMKPKYSDKHLSLKNEDNASSITGKAPTMNFGRGSRKKAIFFDEIPHWQWGRAAYASASQTTKCRIMNGTPNGKYDVYGEKMTRPGAVRVVWPGREEMVKAKGI